MKKLIFCVGIFLVSTGLALAQHSSDISRQVTSQMLNHTRSTDAPKEAVFSIKLQIRTHFTNTSPQTDYLSYTSCSAVKIDNHWLLASLACRDTTPVTTLHDIHGNLISQTVQEHRISGIKVGSAAIDKEDIFIDENSQLILIRANEANTSLLDELADSESVADLLITNDPRTILDTLKQTYLNRQRQIVGGRRVVEVAIQQYDIGTKCYWVKRSIFDGKAGDPLFVSLEGFPGVKFLAGLNSAPISWGEIQTGQEYRALDSQAYAFIRNTVSTHDAAAWQRIAKHVNS